jgi:small subunit ribosomal protein S3
MKRAVQSAMRWAPRASASTAPAVSAAPRSRAPNGIARAACRCTRCAPTSITEAEAKTAYGTCGVKVWIFKGEILEHDPMAQDRLMMPRLSDLRRPPASARRCRERFKD